MPPSSRLLAWSAAVALASACVVPGSRAAPSPTATLPSPATTGPVVRVGVGPEPESRLLGHVMAAVLTAGGYSGEVVEFSDARDSRQALELGAVDARPGYTGETWLEVMGRPDPPGDPVASYTEVREFDADNGILWLQPEFAADLELTTPPANATFAFVVQGPPGRNADLRTMSQLATRIGEQPDAALCVDQEFEARRDGLTNVLEAYSIRQDVEVLLTDPAEAVLGVAASACIAGLATATDGAVWGNGLRPLVDDLRVFPAFIVTPQLRQDSAIEEPGVLAALTPLAEHLTTQALGQWNARVTVGEEPIQDVAADAARSLLQLAGRPPTPAPTTTAPGT